MLKVARFYFKISPICLYDSYSSFELASEKFVIESVTNITRLPWSCYDIIPIARVNAGPNAVHPPYFNRSIDIFYTSNLFNRLSPKYLSYYLPLL